MIKDFIIGSAVIALAIVITLSLGYGFSFVLGIEGSFLIKALTGIFAAGASAFVAAFAIFIGKNVRRAIKGLPPEEY